MQEQSSNLHKKFKSYFKKQKSIAYFTAAQSNAQSDRVCHAEQRLPEKEVSMAKGENIFKRRDGRWEARYTGAMTLLAKQIRVLLWQKRISRPRKR